jgi:serine/threonine-protein kinase RsbW
VNPARDTKDAENPLSMTYMATLQDLPALLRLTEKACRRAHAGEEDAYAIRLAVEEVFSNIMRHGYPAGQPGPVTMSFMTEPHRMQISIVDEAPPFDPRQAPAPELSAGAEARAIGGLGWHLVAQLMDEVRHEALGARGNRLVLIKKLRNT